MADQHAWVDDMGHYYCRMPKTKDIDEDEAARQSGKPKHAFVHITMDPAWVRSHLQLRVNKDLQLSVNGGPWHGSALYSNTSGRGVWLLNFHYAADMTRAKELTFLQVPWTTTYMSLQDNPAYSAFLITKTSNIAF